jgi:two-component system CheB/CheR fusion protein
MALLPGGAAGTPGTGSPNRSAAHDEKNRRIAQLERDLDDSRVHLHTLLHEYDTADEELRCANEEALVANEQLRSLNEKLQAAKEHVQCVNDELEMMNQELQERNQQLGSAADDLVSLLDSLNTPIVMVGPDLSLRRFTASAERLLNLIPSDLGRPLGDLRTNLEAPDLVHTVRGVIETVIPVDRVLKDTEGRVYLLRIRPYLTRERKLDGAVIILTDVDALKAT